MVDGDVEKGAESSSSTGDQSPRNSQHEEKTGVDVHEQPKDPNVVDWDGPDDPENPMNWAKGKRMAVITLNSAITFITPLASSIFAPGVPLLMDEFGSNNTLLAGFVVSVYLLGFVLGPIIVAPASEIVGRSPVYHVGNVVFFVFSIACAVATDIPMFCVFRLLQGAGGAVPLTNGGATISDVVPPESRGAFMAIWALGPLLGPTVGPVIGGFLSQSKGWRWTFWLLTIVSGVLTVLSFVFLRETYAPTILQRKTKRLQKETGNMDLRSKLDTGLQPRDFFIRAIVRPSKLLVLSPIVFILSFYVSIVFSYLYLLFTTFTYVFQENYHFNLGEAGLAYLGIGVGMLIALPIFGKVSDATVRKQTARNNGEFKPEYRLPALVVGPPLIAGGLFGYGWSAKAHVHWIAPILLCLPIGLGQIASFMPVQTYLVDAFGRYAASAVAANTIMRCLFGALIPLAGQSLYAKLGLGWGNSLLAFIALAMSPVPFIFMRYGERIRTRFAIEL